MAHTHEPLTDETLDEAIAFVRRANPFSQQTWGWDTGRFIDWRWGGNTVRDAAEPGWFSLHCRVFRDRGGIEALAIAEYGDLSESVCLLTEGEAPDVVRRALDVTVPSRNEQGSGLALDVAVDATWLQGVLGDRGFEEGPVEGHEWEYELASVSTRAEVPDGFTIESLGDDREDDYAGIEAVIQAAFEFDRPHTPVLRSLEQSPFFRPDLSVFARSPEGRIAAYCRGTVDPANGVCGIDPICTHPDFHRLGLGGAIVRTLFGRLREAGGRFAYIGSAPEPAPGTYLYRSLGPVSGTDFTTWKRPG